jgi:hypothetical protein
MEHIDLAEGRVLARRVLDGLALGFVLGASEIAILDDRDIIPRAVSRRRGR